MKKLLLGSLLASGLLFGQDGDFNIGVSLVGMSMDYREYDGGSNILDSEKSNSNLLVGSEIAASYALTRDADSLSKITLNFMALGGNTQYKGSILNSGLPYGSHESVTANEIYDMELGYKYSNTARANWILSSGIAVGYRYWERSLSQAQIETYKWFSIRPSVDVIYKSPSYSVGLELEYQFSINPIMSASNSGEDFNLGSADIVEVSIPFTYDVSDRVELILAYSYQRQTIKKSNIVNIGGTNYVEPDSTANNQYVKIGANFKF